MKLQSMSFKKKILVSFLLLIFLFVMVLGLLINSQFELGRLQNAEAERFKSADTISKIITEVAQVYAVAADGEINHELMQTKKDLEELKKKMEVGISEFDKIAETPKEKKWAQEFGVKYRSYIGTFEKEMLPELETNENLTPKIRELDGKIDGLRDETLKPIKEFYKELRVESFASDKLFNETYESGITHSIVGTFLVTIFSLALGFILATKISNTLTHVRIELAKSFEQIVENSNKVANAAGSLSESTNEQASAIQETSASMEEMTTMIKKTAESALDSSRLSRTSTTNAQKGRETSENLMKSVNEIEENNKSIMGEVQKGNAKISEIVNLINDIGQKTKVINDIVFQTKLLSFNASVEAARAGEQGKGFAVVAEEVGNLAQMSGKAATEISSMLDESILKVKTVIDETQRGVDDILSKGNLVVRAGLQVASDTSKILFVIDGDIKIVDNNITEISVASDEQAKGAAQVAQALHQLDQATQLNSSLSQQLYSYSKELTDQTEVLRIAVRDLENVIEGS